jgi:hypothetical protein
MNLLYKLLPFGSMLIGIFLLLKLHQHMFDYIQKISSGMGVLLKEGILLKEYFLHTPGIFFGILFILLPIYYLMCMNTKIDCLKCGIKIGKDVHSCLNCYCTYTKSYYECNEDYKESINRRWALLKTTFKEAVILFLIWNIGLALLNFLILCWPILVSSINLEEFHWAPLKKAIFTAIFTQQLFLFGGYFSDYEFRFFGIEITFTLIGIAMIYVTEKREVNFDRKNNWHQLIARSEKRGKTVYSEAYQISLEEINIINKHEKNQD